MSAILKFDFTKKKTITFLWSKLSKLHKKDPILHVATTFSLKQGETRTSRGPIPHPLSGQGGQARIQGGGGPGPPPLPKKKRGERERKGKEKKGKEKERPKEIKSS